MTEPLVPPDIDCTDLDGFMLNVEKLMASELVAISSHEVIGAALMLWCRAWKQLPAASLPNDDKVLAAFARLPVARFRKLREEVLRGFVICSDGRLYHRTLSAEAVKAYRRKEVFQRKRETDAKRLQKWRRDKESETYDEAPNETPCETPIETPDETHFIAEGQGRDRDGTGIKKQKALRLSPPPDARKPKPDEPMDLTAFVTWTRASPQPHVRIIAEWAEATKPDCRTRGQWEVWIKRHLRAAKDISKFGDDQIAAAFGKMRTAMRQGGWLTHYTLETVLKFITMTEAA